MERNEMIQQLTTIIGVLDTVEVHGKQNCANISGVISALEDMVKKIINEDRVKKTEKREE